MDNSPGKRLAAFRASLNVSQRDLGLSLWFSGGLIGQLEADLSPPSRRFLEAISERYHLNSDWLLNGRGEMLHSPQPGFSGRGRKRIEPPDSGKPSHGDFLWQGEDFAMVSRMDLSVSAGTGLVTVEGAAGESLAFSRRWLLMNRINSDLAVLVRVRGDSMAPGIADGALVLVHLPEMSLAVEGVYAFTRGDSAFIKRLVPVARNKDGRPSALVILSDNPAYPPESLSGSEMNSIRIVGRVRCVIATL